MTFMTQVYHPRNALFSAHKTLPAIAACEHYAGQEKFIIKAFSLQSTSPFIFDVTCDCEDGASLGHEIEHAELIAELIAQLNTKSGPQKGRIGVRLHDFENACWRRELEIIVGRVGQSLGYVTLPKVVCPQQTLTCIDAIQRRARKAGRKTPLPVHILIETPQALSRVAQLASLPHVEVLDFGLLDFISEHHGAIPESAMHSPEQFRNPAITAAKRDIVLAALSNGCVPSHSITTELNSPAKVFEDARLARQNFGFLRMWSIHPSQIEPITKALQPDYGELELASSVLLKAYRGDWKPIEHQGKLYDRASYRHLWQLVERAQIEGQKLNAEVIKAFFN